MKSIALNIIVGKGEAKELNRCLTSVSKLPFDEKVVVQTFEDEAVKHIAQAHDAKVYFFEWTNNFSAARNYAIEQTQSDYIMWMDADDVIDEGCVKGFQEAFGIVRSNNKDVFEMVYNTAMDAQGRPMTKVKRERFFRNTKAIRWERRAHEGIRIPEGAKVSAIQPITVDHYPNKSVDNNGLERNLKILQEDYESGDSLSQFYYGKELLLVKDRVEEGIEILKQYIHNIRDKNQRGFLSYACFEIARFYTYQVEGGKHGYKKDTLHIAENYSRIGLTFDKNSAEHHVVLGDIFDYRGEKNKALNMYTQALAKDTNQAGVNANMDFYALIPAQRMSIILFREGEYEQALYYNRMALEARPEDKQIQANRKIIFEELSKQISKQIGGNYGRK